MQTVEVSPGDSKLVTLSSYPPSCGVYEDVLTCRIAGNPVPVCFPIACTGARPLAYLRLTGKKKAGLAMHEGEEQCGVL